MSTFLAIAVLFSLASLWFLFKVQGRAPVAAAAAVIAAAVQ